MNNPKVKNILKIVLLASIGFFASCEEKAVDPPCFEVFQYYNSSKYNLNIETYPNRRDKSNFQEYTLPQGQKIDDEIEPKYGSSENIIVFSDSIAIHFDTNKTIGFTIESQGEFNPLNRNNHTLESSSTNRRCYSFSFTNNLFAQ